MNQTYQVMPPLSAEDRDALKESIRANGVLVPVEEDEHANILDGYHRVELWHELRAEGVRLPDYPRIIRPGLTDAEKRAHARALNLSRRHLTREQRRQLIEDQLRETPERSDNQIADALGVDDKTVAKRRQHLEATSEIPKLERTVGADGKSRPARRPSVIAKNGSEARQARKAIEATGAESLPFRLIDVRRVNKVRRETALAAPGDVPTVQTIGTASLRCGSLLEALADVPDGSVDLMFTDPPYNQEGLPLFADLSLLASRILKDDGVLVVYAGKFHLPMVMASLGLHLDWHWLISLVHAYGGDTCINSRFINCRFRPLLMYTKRGCRRRERWLEDIVRGEGREKDSHAWQQGEAEAAYLIGKLTDPGELVVDPFLGSGTTAAAAVKLGRRFIGCDINPGAVAIAQQRLAGLMAEDEAEAS
jgi:ParB-like chromosome segregation protein Spo0J